MLYCLYCSSHAELGPGAAHGGRQLRSILHANVTLTTQLANCAGTWSSTIHLQNWESIGDINFFFFGHFPSDHHRSEGCNLCFDMDVIKALVQNGDRRHVSAFLNQGPAVPPPPPQTICLGYHLEIRPNKPRTPPDERTLNWVSAFLFYATKVCSSRQNARWLGKAKPNERGH